MSEAGSERADWAADMRVMIGNPVARSMAKPPPALRDLQPVDAADCPPEGILPLGGERPSLDELGDDALDQRDLRVLESLELPPVEPDAEVASICSASALLEGRLDHVEHARLPRTPVAMHADGDRGVTPRCDELNHNLGDRLVPKEVDAGFLINDVAEVSLLSVVAKTRSPPPAHQLAD